VEPGRLPSAGLDRATRPLQVPLGSLHPAGLPSCDLLASTEVAVLSAPVSGSAGYGLAIPNAPILVGCALSHQLLQVELGGMGQGVVFQKVPTPALLWMG